MSANREKVTAGISLILGLAACGFFGKGLWDTWKGEMDKAPLPLACGMLFILLAWQAVQEERHG